MKDLMRRAIDKHYNGSISAAARRLKISDAYLGRIVRGERQPTQEMAERIAELLGISARGVLGPEPPAETPSERMTRRRSSDRKFLRALATVQKTPEHRAKMRAAAAQRGRKTVKVST